MKLKTHRKKSTTDDKREQKRAELKSSVPLAHHFIVRNDGGDGA